MKCALCDNQVIKRQGSIEFNTRSLGIISVPGLEFMECIACHEKLLTSEQSDKAIDYIANKEQELIRTLPIGEFITANKAADLLAVTKQAFSKNPKIKAGMMYSVKIGNRSFYHRKSVELFRVQGNGKFLLTPPPKYKIGITQIDDWVGAESGNIDEKENFRENILQIGDHLLTLRFVKPYSNKVYSDLKSAISPRSKFYTMATSSFSANFISYGEKKPEPITTGDIK
jgi:hypothetical protein